MIKVLIIDDSAVMRCLLTEILNEAPDIEVVGASPDPIIALPKIQNLRPDVITLDVEMPRMDGLTFLGELMRTNPLPVIMISALTEKGCDVTLRALELGAVDYVQKPALDLKEGIRSIAEEIHRKVRIASRARVRITGKIQRPKGKEVSKDTFTTTDKIIAIGASTGGTQAITEIITSLPESIPGIVIVQHMPPLFTRSFAKRLDSISRLDVKEAETGDRVLRGTVLIAPGDRHMIIRRNGAMYYTEITDEPMVNFVRPSVDVLFSSVSRAAGKNAIGIILTGMGEDGARGLLEMKNSGAFTIAQDEESSIVFGMPRKAIEIGAAERVASIDEIKDLLIHGSLFEHLQH